MRTAIAKLLHGYQRWLSPMFPPACRFVPTCSEYALEAVERYGVLRGGCLAAWRLVRCNPLSRGGLDPVVRGDAPTPCPAHGAKASSPAGRHEKVLPV